MLQHRVLTGSANFGHHCYSVGQVGRFTFWAYGSGCDLVISSSNHHPIQVISGVGNVLITAIDCSDSNGRIAVAYGKKIVVYKPESATSHTKSNFWFKESSFSLGLDGAAVGVLSWNLDGNMLLVGSSCISLWSCEHTGDDFAVSFHLDNEESCLNESDLNTSWKEIWVSGMHESPAHLAFSPTRSKHHLFASVTNGDCMIKVWYSHCKFMENVNVLSRSREEITFSFAYLLHPQPVVGFEWRKNLILDRSEKCANVLISSCQDQICRIWVETKRPVSNLMHFHTVSGVGGKLEENESHGDKFKKTASTPILSNSSGSIWNSVQSKIETSPIRHFHIAATINPSTDIPLLPSFNLQSISTNTYSDERAPVFTVHWLNNKFYQNQFQYNRYADTNVSPGNNMSSTMDRDFISPNKEGGDYISTAVTESLIRLWRESRDALFSIHPSDGSLLVWHIDWLDEDRSSLIRQPQVCFSSRIPMVFASGDAATVCPRMVLFVNYSAEQNLLHSASCMSFKSGDSDANVNQEVKIYSDVKLLSKHNDGSLNLWQISFSDANDFSSVTSISHSARLCGHCFHMSGILSHPILPLLVTTASHNSDLQPNGLDSELILWRSDPVGPLLYSGGLSELARVSCQKDHLFNRVAWFSLLFPNWCLGPDNKSPSTGLIALNNNEIQIYQAVVDASQILSDLMTPTSDNHSFSTRDIISQQSSAHPGCLLHLHTEKDQEKSWGNIIFLDTFDVSLLSSNLHETCGGNVSKFSKNYYVVMVSRLSDDTYIHTWLITFRSSLASAKEMCHRKSVTPMFDSSDDDSEVDEVPYEEPTSFSSVVVDVVKLASQKLSLQYSVVDTCSGVGKFNLFFIADQDEHVHAAPFHLCTLSRNGSVNFWHCNISENPNDQSRTCCWKLWQPADHQPCSSPENSVDLLPYHISVSGDPVLIKAANNTLLACMSIKNFSRKVSVMVSIFESASSGGSCWKLQEFITYYPRISSSEKVTVCNLHLDWLSKEDGSFFLAVGYATHIEIYSLAPKDMFCDDLSNDSIKQNNQLLKQASLDVHTRLKLFTSNFKGDGSDQKNLEAENWRLLKWTKLTELSISDSVCKSRENVDDCPSPITVSWARDGVLIVATETEMHVFSQWLDDQKENAKLFQVINNSVNDSNAPVTKGLFEVAASLCPSLQQYHPLILSELLNSGHMDAVREILIHLAICINGDYQDTTCQQIATQLSKYCFCDQLSRIIQLCTSGNRITPLPLYKLVQTNGKIGSSLKNSDSTSKDTTSASQALEIGDNLDDMLAEDDYDKGDTDNELDEILGVKSNKKKAKVQEHVDLTKFPPNYFGKEHCKVIKEFLTRSQLPGLTSLDQMELMALADTLNLANASNLKQETSDENIKENGNVSNLGERGYAVSGSGAGSLDTCGIRFIMAMHNHLCLLNSLPSANKSALLKQGLSTCHFAWAFHSETEEEMLSLLPSVQRGAPDWTELRSFGVAWWIRSTALLRRLVEQLARAAFLKKNDPLDAALFYLALNKKPVLCGLYRTIKDVRMHQFFQHNFAEDRWRRAALKNAFALMGKQRFQHAVAFFLLAGAIRDAADICIEKMKDFQLALLIVRLRESSEVSQSMLLKKHILPKDSEENGVKLNGNIESRKMRCDSFVRSMAYWTIGYYEKSLNTLHENLEHEDIADVFNFYMFLRSHPLLLRNKAQMQGGKLTDWNTSSSIIEDATDQERQLVFQTALVHLEAGCPMLALDCLSVLPRYMNVIDPIKSSNKVVVTDAHEDEKIVEKQPDSKISSVEEVDWSQPVGFDDGDDLELDWSEEEDEEESDDDASRPRINVSIEVPTAPSNPEIENNIVSASEEPVSSLKQDVFVEHLKMTACFQVFVQELKAIANAYNADGGQLRSKLYTWLEKASTILQKVFSLETSVDCSKGLNPIHKQSVVVGSYTETDESPSVSSLGAKVNSSQAPSLHELILADNEDWKTRRTDLAQRRKWLACHHNFLRTLLSYCILHDSACGVLATVRMELLLLIQESLHEKNSTRSLASPLPMPSDSIPLITSSISSSKTVVADPLTYLCHISRDILRAVLDFSIPPHPDDDVNFAKSAMVCSQAAALSTCIYQSLCDTSAPTFRSQLLKSDTRSLDGVLDDNSLSSSPTHLSTSHSPSPFYIAPSTAPSQWPGVALLQAKLSSEGASENRTKVLILLCEVTVAVYISLLIHGLHSHSTSLLYRITNHVLGSKMWNAVFGGGAKIPIKYTKSSSNLKQMASMNISKLRERLNHKVLSTSAEMRAGVSASSGGHDSLTYREKFLPPEVGLWDWFLTKPFRFPSDDDDVEYDSDAEDDFSESHTEDEEHDLNSKDGMAGPIDASHEEERISYGWKLMRLAIVKVVISNLQSFFPLVGFELNELSTNSPFLFAVIRILQEWQSQLHAELDAYDEAPADLLPSSLHSSVNASRPVMLRYQTMLERDNTPFNASDKVSLGCKRLWHSLVKKEQLQELFIKYIFHTENKEGEEVRSAVPQLKKSNQSGSFTTACFEGFDSASRIVHKDHELIAGFCINNVNSNFVALASAKDVQEIDLSDMLAADSWSWFDDSASAADKSSTYSKDEDFLLISSVPSKPRGSQAFFNPASNISWSNTSQTGQGANILMKRSLSTIRRMEAHPTLPYYVSGGRDGAIYMWEWGHQQQISQFQPSGHASRISNLYFSSLGNKLCSADGDGYVTLWQVSLSQRPFFKHMVHDRGANDLCFLSSASVIATTGLSSSSRNVAVWDTLLPRRSVLVKGIYVRVFCFKKLNTIG